MHELSLCEGVRQLLEDNARRQGYRRVKAVWLEIGRLAAVDPEAMRFAFDVAMRGSIADGARLELVEVEGRGECPQCGKTVPVAQRYDECPECGGFPLRICAGEEMRIRQLEVE